MDFQNRKYQTMYDCVAPGYGIAERLYRWVSRKPDYRPEYLRELEMVPGARVFEVSGAHLPYLRPDIEFFGLDLSWGMLCRCRHKSEALATQRTTVPARSRAASVLRRIFFDTPSRERRS